MTATIHSLFNSLLANPPIIYDMIYLLTAIGLTPGGNSTVAHIYTQTNTAWTTDYNAEQIL